jgi:hypothetical protein
MHRFFIMFYFFLHARHECMYHSLTQLEVPYFSIDKVRIIYTKSLNSLKTSMRGIHLKGMRGKSNVMWKYYLICIDHYSNPKNSSSDSILLLVTHILLKNYTLLCLHFLTTASRRMNIIYTPKGVMKMLGWALSIYISMRITSIHE